MNGSSPPEGHPAKSISNDQQKDFFEPDSREQYNNGLGVPTDNQDPNVDGKTPRPFAENAAQCPGLNATIAHRVTHHHPQLAPGLDSRMGDDSPSDTAGATSWNTMPTISYEPHASDVLMHTSLASPTAITFLGSSLRSNVSTSSLASTISVQSGSTLHSPYLSAMTDLTPLPSPTLGPDVLPPWRKARPETPTRSRASSLNDQTPTAIPTSQPTSPNSPTRKKKGYSSLMQEASIANAAHAVAQAVGGQELVKPSVHTRHRSVSDFIPEQLQNIRQRHVTFGEGDTQSLEAAEYHMHRETNLAAQRGLTTAAAETGKQIPTPPPSSSSVAENDEADEEQPYLEDGTASEYLEIHCGIHNKRRKFRQLRRLGQGTFSTVMLATRERGIPAHPTPEIEEHLDPHKLVAVKIVEHGPAGGADEERIEISLKREVGMLKNLSHPSLIHLKACEDQSSRTLLVLTYCPGGDLFEFASQRRELLTAPLVQRMFAELLSAVRYLHTQWIVHRDIKLENILVNMSASSLRSLESPRSHPTPIVTLTDLGLSRKIPEPPGPPLLLTRCGSEDYAAPEILLGQPYDGRLTDGWALGVVLYALMEGRLPFDAPPGKPDRSRNTHRIAHCKWIWCRFGDQDGEWDPTLAKDFEGAQMCVEGLLKKVRMGRKPLEEIEKLGWVQSGICISGGLRVREEDEDDEML